MSAKRNRRRYAGLTGLLLGVAVCVGFTALQRAAAEAVLEYEVKAAFLLNFTKFTDWPTSAFANPDSPLTICILGRDPFGRALDDVLQGEEVDGHKLAVRRISQNPEPQACQVLFVGNGEKEVRKILGGLGRGVLTAGDGEGFIRDGGIIAFVLENRRVRFDINQSAAEAAGLKLSSQLLSVARSVQK